MANKTHFIIKTDIQSGNSIWQIKAACKHYKTNGRHFPLVVIDLVYDDHLHKMKAMYSNNVDFEFVCEDLIFEM